MPGASKHNCRPWQKLLLKNQLCVAFPFICGNHLKYSDSPSPNFFYIYFAPHFTAPRTLLPGVVAPLAKPKLRPECQVSTASMCHARFMWQRSRPPWFEHRSKRSVWSNAKYDVVYNVRELCPFSSSCQPKWFKPSSGGPVSYYS
jgi:hypothetical protein